MIALEPLAVGYVAGLEVVTAVDVSTAMEDVVVELVGISTAVEDAVIELVVITAEDVSTAVEDGTVELVVITESMQLLGVKASAPWANAASNGAAREAARP